MNLSRIPYVALVAGLALSGYVSPLVAGEKLQLSGSSDKANKSTDLSGPRTKPLLPTLDFKQITGQSGTVSAEQLAPVNPPQATIIDSKLLEKNKKDRDWLKGEDKEEEKNPFSKDNNESDPENKKDKNNQDKKDKRKLDDKKDNDPFDRSKKDRYDLDADKTSNIGTNRISFSSREPNSDRRSNNPSDSRPNTTGGMFDNSAAANIGRPKGAQANPFENNERAETLKMLGITPPSSQNNLSAPSAVSLIKGNPQPTGANPFDNNLARGSGNNQPGALSMPGRDAGYKSPFGNTGLPGTDLAGPAQAAPIAEPFKQQRKPIVLPMPQRKF